MGILLKLKAAHDLFVDAEDKKPVDVPAQVFGGTFDQISFML